MSDSVSFDPAAEYYDETRRLTPEASRATVRPLGSRAPLTSALPRDRRRYRADRASSPRGRQSGWSVWTCPTAMLRKLAEKSGGRPAFPVLRGDATRLPFRDAVFGAAVARHVLHLIPRWQDAVAELARVVRPGGVLLLNIGADGGPWEELQDRLEAAAGPGSRRVGLTAADHALLDETLGAARRSVPRAAIRMGAERDSTPERFFEEAEGRVFSWTWKVPEDRLTAAIDTTRAWAQERFGSSGRRPRASVPDGLARVRRSRLSSSRAGPLVDILSCTSPGAIPRPVDQRRVHGADHAGREDLDGRRARGLGRRQDPRALPRAALRHRCIRGHPRVRDRPRSRRVAHGRAPPPPLPLREAVSPGHPVLGRSGRRGDEGRDPRERLAVVLRPAARDPRLRRDGRQPAQRAGERHHRRVAVGRVPRRGRARAGRADQDQQLAPERPELAARPPRRRPVSTSTASWRRWSR